MESIKMKKIKSSSAADQSASEDTIPLPIQTFLWRQTSSFLRPKLGRLHEASCIFCQQAPGHHEMKEACKSLEKILVQNIQLGLSPSFSEAIRSVSRWRFIQASLPHVMLCTAQLISERKDTNNLQNVGTAASKLLYTLHWILLDAAEECADADRENGVVPRDPFPYIFPLTCIQEFVYLFAPLRHLLKEADLQNFRLENGLKIWPALWDYRHPNALCFTAPVRPKKNSSARSKSGGQQPPNQSNSPPHPIPAGAGAGRDSIIFNDVFSGSIDKDSDIGDSRSLQDVDIGRQPGKDNEFPETIPEETSSTEEEHVVIFRLPSAPDSDGIRDSSIYRAESSIIHPRSYLSADYSGEGSRHGVTSPDPINSKRLLNVRQESWFNGDPMDSKYPHRRSSVLDDITAATFLDVAAIRCLFMPRWSEEGVHWALQFLFYRLQEISEEMRSRCPQRKRSSSLPVPKIEVSLCSGTAETGQKPSGSKLEAARWESPEQRESPPAQNLAVTRSKEETSTSAAASPATSKRCKMSDLRAFVETRLLSRSDKMLEKMEDKRAPLLSAPHVSSKYTSKSSLTDADHHSIPPRPLSALANTRALPLEWNDDAHSYLMQEPLPLVKGKSMPSLRYLGMGGNDNGRPVAAPKKTKESKLSPAKKNQQTAPVMSGTHPVITVTEPLATPSSSKAHIFDGNKRPSSPMNRSQTDSNISYPFEELPEATGASHFVNREGGFDFHVILEAIHSVTTRSDVCSVRVCETSLSMLELLLDLGVVSSNGFKEDPNGSDDGFSNNSHTICIDLVARIFQHVGCPHGCGESRRDPSSDYIRSQGLLLLAQLHRISNKNFRSFLRHTVTSRYTLAEVVDFLHALVGFCIDPGFILSPISQKRNSRIGGDQAPPGMGYGPNFNSPRTIEGHVINCIFKPFVTRLTSSLKFLKSMENVALYCDVRQLLSYIKDVHGGIFRRVLLSGLLDAAARPQTQEDTPPENGRYFKDSMTNEDAVSVPPATFFVVDETTSEKGRKNKKQTASEIENWNEDLVRKGSVVHALALSAQKFKEKDRPGKQRFTMMGSGSRSHRGTSGKLGIGWMRKDRRFPAPESPGEAEQPPMNVAQAVASSPALLKLQQRGSGNNNVGISLQKARKRVEHHLTRIGFGKTRRQVISREATPDPSRRNSLEMEGGGREILMVVPRERKMVSGPAVYDGMLRLSFLLEACQPGTVPDAHLIAAVLDLPQAPVIARAAFLFECAHFVHRCNRGQWPSWMKLNLPFYRPSGPLSNRGTPSGQRRTHILQRLGGRMFFSWAEAIGVRLEEILIDDALCNEEYAMNGMDEQHQRLLLEEDENEDFLVEASVNPSGRDFPWALRLAACMLLYEITAFMRDSFRRLPRSARVSQRSNANEPTNPKATGSLNVGYPPERTVNPSSDRMASGEPATLHNPSTSLALAACTPATANPAGRRWSMALSSMGQSQASAQSLQSIAGDGHSIGGVPGERKISFVLHEPDDESLDSSNTTLTFQGDDANDEKRNRRLAQGRPYLLRRSTMSNTGSFKRRSLKLRRSHRESSRRDPDAESIKRSDSVRSKRKVSSISDRSDISDVPMEHDISGEESPGILSDDQPPESPSEGGPDIDEGITTRGMPWLRAVLLLTNSFNYHCTHQHVCHPRCFRRQSRACSRLLFSVRKIYGDEPQQEAMEFLSLGKKSRHHKDDAKSKDKAKGAQSRPGSPLKRKDSVNKKEKSNNDLLSKTSSCHSSTGGLSRDHIEHDPWDRSKITNLMHGKSFPHEGEGEECKAKKKEDHPIVKYLKFQVMDLFQAPLLVLIKSATIMNDEAFLDIIPIAWELLLDVRKETVAAAAAMFILSAVRCPEPATTLLNGSLRHADPVERVKALLKFQVLWRSRYQVWPRMEEGAAHTFKVPPHSIEFTLPSPRIGIESLPVVDPPWMPYIRSRVQEVTLNQETHRSLVTATKTRKKQQAESLESALKEKEDKKCSERENFVITAVPVIQQASYEPALHHLAGDDHDDDDETQQQSRIASQPLQTAQVLFPSCLCSAIVAIVDLLDDSAITPDGVAVCGLANEVLYSCLVEDTALFLRHVLEKMTREKQDEMFAILRRLLRFVPYLPQQAAFTIHNYLIGYIMFYVRSPMEGSQELVANAMSLVSLVAPGVQGLLLKDLKQILRKEQCDAAVLITANVPSAKKIVVHGPPEPDSAGIPSQFPIQEDTQFSQILQESLDFFSIDENKHREYFLVDMRTGQIHNPLSYVRDYYFFKRSQNPQLNLVHMDPLRAHEALQKQAFVEKMMELGKVQLVSTVLRASTQMAVVPRVLFLHEELMKLPSFPRKALEVDLSLCNNGSMGKELSAVDFMHKLSWVKLVRQMFEVMVGNFAYSADIHLFINVVNGALVLYCEDAVMLRFCLSTYINAGHQFRNVFAVNGYSLIIPTIMKIYSNYQSNPLVTRTIEFTVQQFYIMHRKPFMLQLFGSVAPLLDTDETSIFGDATKVRVQSLFRLLLSLERVGADPLHLLDLVGAEKPLRALDFCYHGESDTINVLESIALAVMGASYAIDTPRGHQLLMILEAIVPAYLRHLQTSAGRKDPRTERDILHQLGVAMKTLLSNAEALTKHYSGPQRTYEKSPSQKPLPRTVLSTAIEIDEDSHSRFLGDHHFRNSSVPERTHSDDSEVQWQAFRMPRMTLLSLVSDYYRVCTARLTELNKKQGQDKTSEPFDVKCNTRLADIAHALLKVASYDATTMACRGLQQYMTVLMPNGDWSQEPMKQVLNTLFRRLDKIFTKINKIPSVRKNVDWDAAAVLLKGVYLTLRKSPFIVHLTPLRSLITTCQSMILGDLSASMSAMDGSPVHRNVGMSSSTRRSSLAAPPAFCSVVVQLIAMQILALGETYSLEQACGGNFIFPSAERTESILLNLLLPLCLRVGSGRKDTPRVRQSDISFALTVVLHALNPPVQHQPVRATVSKNISGDGSRGSLSVNSSDARQQQQQQPTRPYRPTLLQVAFLGLKVLMTCFSQQLTLDWPRVARCVREIGERREDVQAGGGPFWNFLIFAATQRGPLFPLILPLMWSKVSVPTENDAEQILQDLLRQKLNGSSEITPLPSGELMDRFLAELMMLNDEFANQREDEAENDNRRNIVQDGRSEMSNPSANSRRPTIDSNASRDRPNFLLAPSSRGASVTNVVGLRRQWSVRSESRPAIQATQRQISLQTCESGKDNYRLVTGKMTMRRTSYAGEATCRPNLGPGTTAASDTRLNRRSAAGLTSTPSLLSDSLSEVDFRELDETSNGDLSTPQAADGASTSLDSPSAAIASAAADHASSESVSAMHPRLHRQKLQSKNNRGKNFRSFKSGKAVANIEVSHIEVEQEQVSLPSVKPPACAAPMPEHGQPFQLLLVPSGGSNVGVSGVSSRMGHLQRRNQFGGIQRSPSIETRLTSGITTAKAVSSPPERAESGSVTIGMAVQVPTSSYVPAKPPQRGAGAMQNRSTRTEPPPPVPPRVHPVRSTLQPPSNRPCSAFLEHPLLEESDTMSGGTAKAGNSSSQDDSDVENSQSGMLACVSAANDTSIESLVLEETALLLPAATSGRGLIRNNTERDENTLI